MAEQADVAIDARWLRTGLGTYTYNLVTGLGRFVGGLKVRSIVNSHDSPRLTPFCDQIRIVNAPIYSLGEQIQVPLAARGANLLHVPHYNIPLFYRGRLIVTIHDLIHLGIPGNRRSAKGWVYAWPMLKIASQRASHIITVSEYSKNQLVERLGLSTDRISVIYNGASHEFHPGDQREARKEIAWSLGIHEPFLLYVGNLKPHKNVGCLLRAFACLCTVPSFDRWLLIVGDDRRWRKNLVAESERLGVRKRVSFLSRVDSGLLAQLYIAADLLVMPSLVEGFGLPVLEAMVSGTPVVCARAASLPEVGGEAVEYFDPSDSSGLAYAIERVLGSPDLQASLKSRGLRRASLFSWEECARKHSEIYRRAAA